MALNCSACNDLRENAAEFVQNGVTDTVCTSLKNDTGFNPSNDRNDCTDLNDANDCLIGNAADELEAYDVCDWKEFMKNFIPNLYNVIKAMICAICGLWCNFHALIAALQNTSSFAAKQVYLRSSDVLTSDYWHPCTHTGDITFNEADHDLNDGDFYAPADGVAIVSFCFAIKDNDTNHRIGYHVAAYDSGETVTERLRVKRSVHIGTLARQESNACTTAVKMTKGHYLKLHAQPAYDDNPSSAQYRLHQVNIVFIPNFHLDLNVETSGSC